MNKIDPSNSNSILKKRIITLYKNCLEAFQLSPKEQLPIVNIAEHTNLSIGTEENYITQAVLDLAKPWAI